MSKATPAVKKAPKAKPDASVLTAALAAATAPVIVKAANAAAPADKPAAAKPAKQTKEERAAERAKRFPTAAAQEVAAKEPKAKPVKVVKEVVAFIAKTLPKGAMAHIVSMDKRPRSGPALYAHTHAALNLLGMMAPKCPAVPKANVLTIMGPRAVAYHLEQNNMIQVGDTIALTPAGLGNFKGRAIDGKMANAYMDLFVSGKIDPVLKLSKGDVYQGGL